MTKRIFRSIFLASAAAVVACLVLVLGAVYNYFAQVQLRQLRQQTQLAAQGVSDGGLAYLQAVGGAECRITWIAPDGTVLFDNQSESAEMENHLQREEVQQAMQSGYGESRRYSSTLMERSLYAAQLLPDKSVLRLSVEQATVLSLVLSMAQPICLVLLAALLGSAWLASHLSKRIVKPLNEINLDDPITGSEDAYDELSPLLRRLDSQQRQLRQQSQELRRQQDEFDAVVCSMEEGLVLLGMDGRILSINPAAVKLFDAGWCCRGDDFLAVCRLPEVQSAVRGVLTGSREEKQLQLSGRLYQLQATAVFSEETAVGAVLLLFDVTEKQHAEQMRREFTANVSHELKTPLQSISGYAELLAGGMVQPGDVPSFGGKIYNEAQRLIRLVADILRLSRLDEGTEDLLWEEVELYSLVRQTLSRLAPEAEQRQVALACTGSAVVVSGVRQLLEGILFNLCDNAIQYNHPGGQVTVRIGEEDGVPFLQVQDTGIGIPEEDQNRIFERFYRVDKSRSRAAGGTGLGLSIVKNSARILGARLELHSMEGVGTTVTVHFPRN